MKTQELIEKLRLEDPEAEVLLSVDIQGTLEFRPVGAARSCNFHIAGYTLHLDPAYPRKGVILDPDHTLDEAQERKNEEDRKARLKAKWALLPDDDLDALLDPNL